MHPHPSSDRSEPAHRILESHTHFPSWGTCPVPSYLLTFFIAFVFRDPTCQTAGFICLLRKLLAGDPPHRTPPRHHFTALCPPLSPLGGFCGVSSSFCSWRLSSRTSVPGERQEPPPLPQPLCCSPRGLKVTLSTSFASKYFKFSTVISSWALWLFRVNVLGSLALECGPCDAKSSGLAETVSSWAWGAGLRGTQVEDSPCQAPRSPSAECPGQPGPALLGLRPVLAT